MLSIGFILLTHAHEAQALRLSRTLTRVFGDAPIVCHHDFSQMQLETRKFPSNVTFVQPHVNTRWGTISLVQAMLSALRVLYDKASPDWFYLLSGADYPIRSAAEIRAELSCSPFDAYMRMQRIDHRSVPPPGAEDSGGLESPSYRRLAYKRYIGRSLPIPSLRHPHRGPAAMHLHLLNPTLLRPFHPFNDNYFCYAGDQWFAANAKCAAALLSEETERLMKYFKGRFPPDEAVCPTILGNASEVKVSAESKHYIRWDKGHHPRLLEKEDLPAALASSAHFARKFAPESPALDVLDERLGRSSEPGHDSRAWLDAAGVA